jgi:hypothetical protein
MSASTCIIYFGLRFDVSAADIETLETRSDTRVVAARKAGLKFYWGNFGAPGERYILFVGAQVGIMGPENQAEVHLSAVEVEAMFAAVRAKLMAAGLDGEPRLHVLWQPEA